MLRIIAIDSGCFESMPCQHRCTVVDTVSGGAVTRSTLMRMPDIWAALVRQARDEDGLDALAAGGVSSDGVDHLRHYAGCYAEVLVCNRLQQAVEAAEDLAPRFEVLPATRSPLSRAQVTMCRHRVSIASPSTLVTHVVTADVPLVIGGDAERLFCITGIRVPEKMGPSDWQTIQLQLDGIIVGQWFRDVLPATGVIAMHLNVFSATEVVVRLSHLGGHAVHSADPFGLAVATEGSNSEMAARSQCAVSCALVSQALGDVDADAFVLAVHMHGAQHTDTLVITAPHWQGSAVIPLRVLQYDAARSVHSLRVGAEDVFCYGLRGPFSARLVEAPRTPVIIDVHTVVSCRPTHQV